MFVDYWCLRCGKGIASNLYKVKELPEDFDWKAHWRARIEAAKAVHKCNAE